MLDIGQRCANVGVSPEGTGEPKKRQDRECGETVPHRGQEGRHTMPKNPNPNPKVESTGDSTTYHVADMRVIIPAAKVAERNPDLAFTVKGAFTDGKGNALTITSKAITNEMVKSPAFRMDLQNGTLTVPAGQRGRPESSGASEEDILARLAAIRGE